MRALAFVVVLVAVGCGAEAREDRSVAPPTVAPSPKPASCEIEVVGINRDDFAPGGRFDSNSEFSKVGTIDVGLKRGVDPMSEPARAAIRPRACVMGGDLVSFFPPAVGADYGYAEQDIVYTVWAKRSRVPALP
jgi:hypothetical protein